MSLLGDGKWFKRDGASESALQNLRQAVGVALPDEYVQLLAYSNGGEGDLPPPFCTLCLDSAEETADPDNLKFYAEQYPGFLVFGGSGGLLLFALDIRGTSPWPIVAFDGIDFLGSLETVADNFGSLISMIGAQGGERDPR